MDKIEIRAQAREKKDELLAQKRGQIAQMLRQQRSYRQAKTVFVSPVPLLTQVRMNVLTDGKTLLCPTAGIRDGFLLLRPYSVPFAKLSHAVSAKGMREYGMLVNCGEKLAGLLLGLLIGDCEALDADGLMIGDGNGFFDLSYAIFNTWQVLEKRVEVIAVVAKENMLDVKVAVDRWDSFADRAISEDGIVEFHHEGSRRAAPEIFWPALPEKRIRKIAPLWKLQRNLTAVP